MEKELLNTLRNKGLVPETYEGTFLQRTLEKRMADCGCDDWMGNIVNGARKIV